MMLSEKINAWLTNQSDYPAGLALLQESGFSGFALTVLKMGDDAYNRNRLETELRTFLNNQKDVLYSSTISSSSSKDNSGTQSSTPKIVLPAVSARPTEEPVGVTELKQLRGRLMDERAEAKSWLRAMIDSDTPQEDLRDRAFRIKAITRELDEIYSQLNFFDEYGYLPPVADDPAQEVDDHATLLNIRTYVSRYRAKVKTAKTTAAREAAQALLDQYEAEKNRLEKKLRPDAV